MDYKNIIKKITKDKKNSNILIVLIIGIILILVGNFFSSIGSHDDAISNDNYTSNYEEKKKSELETILNSIDGIGETRVMITFESGEEKVPAVNKTDSLNTTQEQDNSGGLRETTGENNQETVVMQGSSGSSDPLILKTNNPKVVGVLIVADGASDSITKLEIKKIISSLFDINMDKVNVLEMKK
ncbi:MAG: stage III sporulation protein AG [Clostridiaceae bacterium]